MPLESSITKSVLAYLNSIDGCIAEKTKGDSTSSGRPDINGCFRGLSFRIEMKTPDHKNLPSKKQLANLKKWLNCGSLVMVAYSLKFVKLIFTVKGINPVLLGKGSIAVEENKCLSYAHLIQIKNIQ